MKKLCIFLCFAAVIHQAAAEDYNFFMISDPHFGAAETYCTDPAVPPRFRTKKNIHRADRLMPLYKALFADIAKKSDAKTRFIVEGGDLIEGGTHNEATHRQVLTDALDLMKHYFRQPIYMVKGNHEAYGMGGNEAYQAVLLPEIAKYAGKKNLQYANYSIKQGNDLFIFIDYYLQAKGFDFVRKTLQELKTKPRYVFLVLHLPLLPTSAYAKQVYPLCELLSQYNAVILAGHCHRSAITRFEKDGKHLTQLTVSTFLLPGKIEKMHMKPSTWTMEQYRQYKLRRARKNPRYAEALKTQWFPVIKDYQFFSGVGYARFSVSDKDIKVSFQSADLTQKPLTVQLVTNRAE